MSKFTAKWDGGLRFVHRSATGHEVITDSPESGGGTDTAATPMELVIHALIGCTGVDVALILNRMRQPLEELEVSAEVERAEKHPKIYTKIHVTYRVKGDIPLKKIEHAVELSEGTFCSVSAMLKDRVEITNEIVQEL